MLTGSTTHTDTALHDPVDLTIPFGNTTFLIIMLHISECRFIRKRSNRSCTKCLTVTENNLCILVCFTLIIAREIQVDIRLFVSLESKERLERNIKSRFFLAACRSSGRRRPAYRIRHGRRTL